MRIQLIQSKGQCQVKKGHDNQRSLLSSVTHDFGSIFAIEVDGGIRFNACNHFSNFK